MNSKTLSSEALFVIDQFLHFKAGNAVASIPYFNNKTAGAKFGIRAFVGKGSTRDIRDELDIFMVKHHVAKDTISDSALKKILTDSNLGIDCSGFAYYILDAESKKLGHGSLNKHLTFLKIKGPIAKMWSYLRPIENCDVATFASDTNSRIVPISDIQPGDMITMLDSTDGSKVRNHMLVIHQVDSGASSQTLHYSHAVAYPEDGLYDTGVRQGTIAITNPNGTIIEQTWSESGKTGSENRAYIRAVNSKTEVRRLKWM